MEAAVQQHGGQDPPRRRDRPDWEAGLEKALSGLPPRVLKAAAAASDSLRAVVCEIGRGPQLWMSTGRSVVLAGDFSRDDLERAVEAMAPWGDDGTSGVDGELHFRMLLDSPSGPRGIVVYLHRHRRPDVSKFVPVLRQAVDERRAAMVVVGSPESQEHALREAAYVASSQLGLSTALVDPQGRLGGRGRVPDRSVGAAAWIPVRHLADLVPALETVLMHARPRVLVTVLDSMADVARLLPAGGDTLLILGTPLHTLDPVPQEAVDLSSRWPLAAAMARSDALEAVPDLRRAIAKAKR